MTADVTLFPQPPGTVNNPPPPATAHPADFADPREEQLRERGWYLKPAGRFVGFGRLEPQLDLFKQQYRLGWWLLAVCRVCIVTEVKQLRGEVERMKGVVRSAKAHVGAAIDITEKRIADK